MKRLAITGVLFLAAGALSAQPLQVGSKVDDFSVRDISGSPVSFASLKGDVTVVTFVSTDCPVSNAYNTRMNTIYKEYAGKGVKFIFVNSNRTETAADVVEMTQRMDGRDLSVDEPLHDARMFHQAEPGFVSHLRAVQVTDVLDPVDRERPLGGPNKRPHGRTVHVRTGRGT